MSSVKRLASIAALMAGAAGLAGCDSKDPREDLAGMTDSIAAACPIYNVTAQDKLNCANLGQQHALTLFQYVGATDQFKKACTFKGVPVALPKEVEALLVGSQANRCLSVLEGAATDEHVKKVAREINATMRTGLTPQGM